MNILQKRAWTNLAVVTGLVVTAGVFLEVIMYINVKGNVFSLVFSLPVGIIIGLILFMRSMSQENKLDEREKTISQKAIYAAGITFALCIAFTSFGIFFISGARSKVPAYFMPVLVLIALFIAQLVESVTVLIWCAKEQQDGQ